MTMLSKEICLRCRMDRARKDLDELAYSTSCDNIRSGAEMLWEFHGKVCCHYNDRVYVRVTEPPSDTCPYRFEHAVDVAAGSSKGA